MKNDTQTFDQLRIEYMPLSKLKRAPRNAKLHNDAAIGESFGRFGFVAPIIMDEKSGRLVAGHGRLDGLLAAKAAGKSTPERITEKDGEWFVPVLRGVSFKTAAEAEAYLVADNQLTISGGYDQAQLIAQLNAMVDGQGIESLVGTGWSDDALKELEKSYAAANPVAIVEDAPGPLLDRAAELQKKWQTAPNQIWEISKPETCPHCGEEQ